MKKLLSLLLVAILSIALCSCDSILKKAKSYVTGEEESKMPDDYIATLKNDEYEYELYKEYVKIISYIGEDSYAVVPEEIDDKPVTVIGSLCFFDTEAEITSVKIADSVTIIEESAFYYCDKLESIRIPDSVIQIGSRAFAWCNALVSVSIGSGVTEIPDYCFNHCASLETLIIPSKITKIGVRAFSYCEKLIELIIPSTINEVGERAFVGCPVLEFVTVNNPNIILGKSIFDECEKLVVISSENSSAMNYCAEYGLRWSTSKSIEAVVLGGSENSENSGEEISSDSSVTE